MKKLAEQLIERGLNPRLKWCGFMSPCQIKGKLEEFLPYCNIEQGEMTDNTLAMNIDFHDFVLPIVFELKSSPEKIHYIQKITFKE